MDLHRIVLTQCTEVDILLLITQCEVSYYHFCHVCHAKRDKCGCFWQCVLSGFIHPHWQVEVYYARVVILTSHLRTGCCEWLCEGLRICCSLTWHRGSVSHWCAGSLILSSCCCSSSAPSGRGSWTQSDYTLQGNKPQNKSYQQLPPNMDLEAYTTLFGPSEWYTNVERWYWMKGQKTVLEPASLFHWKTVGDLGSCCSERKWTQERFSKSLGWLMTPGTDGLSQICLTHLSNVSYQVINYTD